MQNTKIEWADHTFNPWIGCTKVGPGCDNCYAEADFDKRRHVVQWGPNQPRKLTAPSTWATAARWNREAAAASVRHRVFCASLADVFDNEVPVQWRISLMALILQTPHLDWLLLTKRIGNAAEMLDAAFRAAHAQRETWANNIPANVWIGATITNQAEADRDIPKLLAVPAAKRFLSIEPLLGPVDLERPMPGPDIDQGGGQMICQPWLIQSGIDWVIVGGESGPGARPMSPDWARSLRDQCQASGVQFMFKQWGEWVDADNGPEDDAAYDGKSDCWVHIDGGHHGGEMGVDFFNTYPMYRVGKKAAGRLLDGREWNEVPV